MKKLLYIIVFLCFGYCVGYSQPDREFIKNNEIEKLNKRLIKLYKKSDCFGSDSLNIINVFYLNYRGGYERTDFINENFLLYAEPLYHKIKSKLYLEAYSYICNKDFELVAVGDSRIIMPLCKFKNSAFTDDKEFVKKIIELNI
ncbi:MAG: hypothetical protein IPO21_21755, partial [Bacteroidales bacterium]|nr:hypothetical protein [Bacteroidales bacterium]